MMYFLTGRIPEPTRVLLVESGSRQILERAIAAMLRAFPRTQFDLCTCFPGQPQAAPIRKVWRVTEAGTWSAKLALAWRMARSRPPIAALLFSGEPVMVTWKLLLLFLLPSKIILVNENGDFFWLDRKNISTLRRFVGIRLGVGGDAFLRSACRLVVFPFVFVFLVLYALAAYVMRWSRLLVWKLTAR